MVYVHIVTFGDRSREPYVSYDQVGIVAAKMFQSFRCGPRFADLVGGVG